MVLRYEDDSAGVVVTHELRGAVQLDDVLEQMTAFLRAAGFGMEGLGPIYSETVTQSTKEVYL